MIKNKSSLYKYISLLILLSIAGVMFTFYYQSIFTRYHSDDYCGSARIASQGLGGWFVNRYFTKTSRFTDIIYIGLVDAFGVTGMQFAPILTLTFWLFSMIWVSKELRRVFGLDSLPATFDYILGGLLVSISVYAAPNRFQTVFWRTGAVHHFVPIVLLTFLLAYLLWRNTNSRVSPLTRGTFLFVFLFSFLIAGMSEAPATVMIAAGVISIGLLMYFGGFARHRSMLLLLSYSLVGAVLGFLVMFFSPGKMFRLSETPTIDVFILRTIKFPLEFLIDTIRVVPIPTLFLFSVSVALFFCTFQIYNPLVLDLKSVALKTLIVLFAMYILIAASFAPSVYAQSYPIARVRFFGYLFFNVSILLIGGFIGIWLAHVVQFSWSTFVGMALLALSIIYPFRIASTVLAEIPEYRSWALAWDVRDAEIRSLKAQGSMDIVVNALPYFSNAGDFTNPPTYINNCAAHFYDVNSITVKP